MVNGGNQFAQCGWRPHASLPACGAQPKHHTIISKTVTRTAVNGMYAKPYPLHGFQFQGR